MPKLEVHHADGSITYSELSPGQPTMVGSAPNCQVVLTTPDVKKVHCRIVWRDDRWRVEVAADAGGVQIGDKLVKAGTLKAGDVLGIGDNRLYFDDADGARAKPADAGAYADEFDAGPSAAQLADGDASEPMVRGSASRRPAHLGDQRTGGKKTWDTIKTAIKGQFKGESDRPPGEERIMGSPLIKWMGFAVLVIIAGGGYFYYDYRERTINEHFNHTQEAMEAGNWEAAIRGYEKFLEEYPGHDLATNAKVQLQYSRAQNATTIAARLQAVEQMIRSDIAKEPGYKPFVPKIGEFVGQIAQEAAITAQKNMDQKSYDLAIEALEVIAKELPGYSLTATAKEQVETTLDAARAAIKKRRTLEACWEAMETAIAAGRPNEAYHQRELLVQEYNDFKLDPKVEELLEKAKTVDREGVRFIGQNQQPNVEPHASALRGSTALMVRKGPAGTAPAEGEVKFCTVSGVLYAHDAATGHRLWELPVGIDARSLPQALPGATEPTVLVLDVRHSELVAVRTRSGKLAWRQPIGEPVQASPLVHRGKIFQPTLKGSLVQIDAATGRLDGRLQFADQRFATTPAADQSGQHLYLLGEKYVLYVLTVAAAPSATGVWYLEHRPDTVFAAPLRMGRYLVIFENKTASACDLRVGLLSPDGATIDMAQEKTVEKGTGLPGWIHLAPAVSGSLMFVATDMENVQVYSAGPPEKAEGFKLLTSLIPTGTETPRGQAYPQLVNDSLVIVSGTKLRAYDWKAEQATLTGRELPFEGAGSQPIQRFPATGSKCDLVYVGRRLPRSASVMFSALDANSLDERWSVLLGSGLVSLVPADDQGSQLVALTRTGHVFRVTAAALGAGGVIDQPAGRIATDVEISGEVPPVVLPDRTTVFAPAGEARQLILRPIAPEAPARKIDLPAPLQGAVVPLGDGLLVPAADGRIYWISPATGKQLAEPYQPALSSDQPLHWRGIAVAPKGGFIAVDSRGFVHSVEFKKEPVPHLAPRGEPTKLAKPVRSGVAVVGNIACCVDEENTLRTFNADTIEAIGEWTMPAPASVGPVVAGGHIFVVSGRDELICVSPAGQRLWQHPLKGETAAGAPFVKDNLVHMAMRSGVVLALKLGDGGVAWSVDTEKPLDGSLIPVGDLLVVAGEDGSLNVLKGAAAPAAAGN